MAAVMFRHVRQTFGASEPIRGVCIDVDDGQIAALVGPYGCGKSAPQRTLGGAGACRLGRDPRRRQGARRSPFVDDYVSSMTGAVKE